MITREQVFAVPTPSATATYSPLSHADLITSVLEQMDKRGLAIKDERYSFNKGGQQMFGAFTIDGGHGEQDMQIGFRNSYDKSMQVGLVAGSRVIVCSNMMFRGDIKTMMMHRGDVVSEVTKTVDNVVASLESNFKTILKDSSKLKEVTVDPTIIAHVLGELFFQESLVTSTQLNVIKNELKLMNNFGNETMWDIYNHTTEALKSCPVSDLLPHHLKVHDFYLAHV
jgi:hypothetical protein